MEGENVIFEAEANSIDFKAFHIGILGCRRHRPLFAIAAVLIFGALSEGLSAQNASVEAIRPASFWDNLDSDVAVSTSGIIRGVQADGEPGLPFKNLFVCLPVSQTGTLILKITSIDGQYQAEATYDLMNHQRGVYQLALELGEKERAFLEKQAPANVAYLAYLASETEPNTLGKILPVHKTVAGGDSNRYSVVLHSKATKTTLQWPSASGAPQSVACQRIRRNEPGTPPIRSFNIRCFLQPDQGTSLWKMYVVRQRFRDFLPSILLPIQFCQ